MKIKVEELLEEIKCALADEFNAKVGVNGGVLMLDFENGQKFEVSVKEV